MADFTREKAIELANQFQKIINDLAKTLNSANQIPIAILAKYLSIVSHMSLGRVADYSSLTGFFKDFQTVMAGQFSVIKTLKQNMDRALEGQNISANTLANLKTSKVENAVKGTFTSLVGLNATGYAVAYAMTADMQDRIAKSPSPEYFKIVFTAFNKLDEFKPELLKLLTTLKYCYFCAVGLNLQIDFNELFMNITISFIDNYLSAFSEIIDLQSIKPTLLEIPINQPDNLKEMLDIICKNYMDDKLIDFSRQLLPQSLKLQEHTETSWKECVSNYKNCIEKHF